MQIFYNRFYVHILLHVRVLYHIFAAVSKPAVKKTWKMLLNVPAYSCMYFGDMGVLIL